MTANQTNLAWDTVLEFSGVGALHLQLTEAIRIAIQRGRVPGRAAMPPSRRLAEELGCSRWVVTEAYGQLVAEGYLQATTGSATRVAPGLAEGAPTTTPAAEPAARAIQFDLRPGIADLANFPRARWADAMRIACQQTPAAELGERYPLGHPGLRTSVAGYLRRARAAVTDGSTTMITHGTSDSMIMVSDQLLRAGHRRIAVEEPSWPRLREIATARGLEVVAVRVDSQGLDVDQLAEQVDLGAVLVSPAHHFPTGVVLSPSRRTELINWARQRNGVIIEDDYDSEFRYDRQPVTALQGMDPARVVLLGTLSKTLSPAIGVGWMVAPPGWITSGEQLGSGPSTLDQLALRELIERGWYERHLRSQRMRYRRRRDALLASLKRALPSCRMTGIAAGLHLVLELPDGADEDRIAAAARGVGLTPMSRYAQHAHPPALVLGYGNLGDTSIDEAVRRLAQAISVP